MPYRVASFSGGKDSTAMVLRMLDLGGVDEVVFCDTSVEFPGILDNVAIVREEVEAGGAVFTALKPEHGFIYCLADKPISSSRYGDHRGYGWPGFTSRWCTKHLKVSPMEHHIRCLERSLDIPVEVCIGIAADESHRCKPGKRYPLVEWGYTESMCLGYCYAKGYDFGGLYSCFSRCSCYLCPFGSLKSLSVLWEKFPMLWSEIRRMEERAVKNGTPNPLYRGEGWEALDERLAKESSSGQSSLSEFGIMS